MTQKRHQEFHISVTPVGQEGQNYYLVRTEKVAPGVPLAEELVTWPVSEWLAVAGHLMNDPLESILQGDANLLSDDLEETNARNSVNLVALGQELYNALFQGTLRDSLITAQGIAQNQKQVLRLRLGLKDTQLARLPWEVMHAGDRPIATGLYIAFSRYQTGIQSASHLLSSSLPNPSETGGINVLMVVASPTDQVRLDLLIQEANQLQAELSRQSITGSESSNFHGGIQLTILEQPGREELTQALEQGRFHVLHYSGHSNLGVNGGEIYLVSHRTGLTETLSGDDLAGLLVNNNIQMAVFNSCLGTYAATNRDNAEAGERNLTETLVKRGIRCVLAMSERIPDDVALTLTQLFYRNLSQGYSVDLCVNRMRQGLISAYGSHQMYWALPILYLHSESNGFLCPGMDLPETDELFDEYDPQLTSNIYSQTNSDSQLDFPLEAIDDMDFASSASELAWWGEDDSHDLDLVSDIDYEDPSYADDSAMVSDLFRQLDLQKGASGESTITGELQQSPTDTRPQDSYIWGEEQNNFPPSSNSQELGSATGISGAIGQNQQSSQPTTIGGNGDGSTGSHLKGDVAKEPSHGNRQTKSKSIWSIPHLKRSQRNILGVVGVGAIATVIGLGWWWQNQQSNLPDIPPIPNQSASVKPISIDLKTSATSIVTAYGSEKLSQGDLRSGLRAVEELLNRNALNNAQTALKLVSSEHKDHPSVNFLWGRLIWQLIQTKDKTYKVDDARRHWEMAAQADPNSSLYSTVLGFAYYAEGNLNRANNSWFKAIDIAVKQKNASNAPKTVLLEGEMNQNPLTAYAGLVIGLYKAAPQQHSAKQEQYLDEAIKLRQMVLKEDPVNFQLQELAKNWLWSEEAMKDWKSLLKKQNPGN